MILKQVELVELEVQVGLVVLEQQEQ